MKCECGTKTTLLCSACYRPVCAVCKEWVAGDWLCPGCADEAVARLERAVK